ncbi:MAG: phosphatase PAP2 family protein [Bacteroidota bacterium]
MCLHTAPVRAQGPVPTLAWAAQESVPRLATADAPAGLDYRILRAWYTQEQRPIAQWMRFTDRTAYPLFYGSPLLMWGLAAANTVETRAAYRFTAAHAATVGSTFLLKRLVKRDRPYVQHSDIMARRSSDLELIERPDPRSFPSGHTALAVALATTMALEYPEPYVVIPSVIWAGSIGLSRVWLGLHYPSDVLLGGLLGGGIAWAVHALGDRIIPVRLR